MNSFYKVINVDGVSEPVNIYFFGDVHVGNVNFNLKAFKEFVKTVKNDPNGWVIGLGDFVDCIVHTDNKRFDPKSIDEHFSLHDLNNLPFLQMEYFYSLIEPIKDRILALVIGNHEAQYQKHNHADVYGHLIKLITDDPQKQKELAVGYVALGAIGICTEKNRERANFTVSMYLNHGDGGTGFTPGYPVNKAFQVFSYQLADVCMMGHIHQLKAENPRYTGYNIIKKKIEKHRRIFGITGSFLNTYVDGNVNYFENKGRMESDIGVLKLSIKRDAKLSETHLTCERIIFDN